MNNTFRTEESPCDLLKFHTSRLCRNMVTLFDNHCSSFLEPDTIVISIENFTEKLPHLAINCIFCFAQLFLHPLQAGNSLPLIGLDQLLMFNLRQIINNSPIYIDTLSTQQFDLVLLVCISLVFDNPFDPGISAFQEKALTPTTLWSYAL